jgi:superfamily I DNA and/or RNA helicase
MNRDFEMKLLTKLQEWGNTMRANLLVADWDIGDKSYLELAKKLGIKKLPSIVLTNSHDPDKNSFRMVIDEPKIVQDIDLLIETLPDVVNGILVGESNAAIEGLKDAIKKRQGSKIRSILKPISYPLSKLKKVNLSFAGSGIDLEFK